MTHTNSHSESALDAAQAWQELLTGNRRYASGDDPKDIDWLIYAKTDKEYDAIVANMIKEVNAYGYAECLAFTKTQVQRRIAAENAVKAK